MKCWNQRIQTFPFKTKIHKSQRWFGWGEIKGAHASRGINQRVSKRRRRGRKRGKRRTRRRSRRDRERVRLKSNPGWNGRWLIHYQKRISSPREQKRLRETPTFSSPDERAYVTDRRQQSSRPCRRCRRPCKRIFRWAIYSFCKPIFLSFQLFFFVPEVNVHVDLLVFASSSSSTSLNFWLLFLFLLFSLLSSLLSFSLLSSSMSEFFN